MTSDVYLSTFGLDVVNLRDLQKAAVKDKVAQTEKIGNNLMSWVKKEATPNINKVGRNLTVAMATAIAVGLVKAYFHLP